jgi:hypothetical protein
MVRIREKENPGVSLSRARRLRTHARLNGWD